MHVRVCTWTCKGETLHKHLYFHPRPGSRSWPIKFSCLTPWPHRKSGLDPWLSSINHTHRSPGETLTVLKLPPIPSLTAWPASKFHLDRFDPSRGWEYSRLCSVPPLDLAPGYKATILIILFHNLLPLTYSKRRVKRYLKPSSWILQHNTHFNVVPLAVVQPPGHVDSKLLSPKRVSAGKISDRRSSLASKLRTF